ncbi:hypothetical protein JG687_00005107 [Phytophthora cactorum]|uniref:Uncharacterized protein n=1 Tax=Phytophthora cactorum TaxID=29920 RepID=A0A8T1UN66_9STRA|nr:hypothetical protein GQ600_14517 [Phytophthora cactorum]KAG6965975.1 hypothetical protein JG687_00005107 [Phytophthora cactorum]
MLVVVCHDTMEGAVTVTTKWSRIYFVSFYVVGVVMVLSLVVAFVSTEANVSETSCIPDTNEALRSAERTTPKWQHASQGEATEDDTHPTRRN